MLEALSEVLSDEVDSKIELAVGKKITFLSVFLDGKQSSGTASELSFPSLFYFHPVRIAHDALIKLVNTWSGSRVLGVGSGRVTHIGAISPSSADEQRWLLHESVRLDSAYLLSLLPAAGSGSEPGISPPAGSPLRAGRK